MLNDKIVNVIHNSFNFMTLKPTLITMNKSQIIVLLLFICAFGNAQEYAIGIKGGLNYYNIGDIITVGSNGPQGPVAGLIFEPVKDIGFQFGAFLNVAFDKFYIRPEINFVTNKNTYDFPKQTSEWTASKIDVPILFGYKIYDPISIYICPSFSFFDNMNLEGANNQPYEYLINFEKTTTSLMFGVQVEFKRFGVDLRYELGLKETVEERQDIHNSAYGVNQADIYSYKPSQISLSLNIFLFRTDGDDIGGFFDGLFRKNVCDCYN